MLAFISFRPENAQFKGFLSIETITGGEEDPESVLRKATRTYERSIIKMRTMITEIHTIRADRRLLPARKIWQLGNAIFELKDKLENLSLQLDGLYEHLVRDLGVKRKWLEKVIILRRYLPKKILIPRSLNWGRCEKGTRRISQRLREGLSVD